MENRHRSRGFTLTELLIVLGIMGIVGAIAIPSFLGTRTMAKMMGDAKSNTAVLQMLMEQRLWQRGGTSYGTAGDVYSWTLDVSSKTYTVSPMPSVLPRFTPDGNSQLNFRITVGPNPATYVVEVTDPKSSKLLATMDQAGKFTDKTQS